MKGRSHRLPQSDPPDDWGDGSWTVDCSCGVTFDDGEEMVSCDECGVWVHTRCSRFVKGEVSFACHKCKAIKRHRSDQDTEETEVAQLLIELPTKTDPCPPPIPPSTGPPHRPPFRLWAEVPLEDRVHIQGIPGGDSALFQGLSPSVFTSELWRCAGYVPKKFNFQYREFPCWDEEEGENTASRGADVLFSLSKEMGPCVPVSAFERRPGPERVRKREGDRLSLGNRSQSCGKKERNKLRLFGSHSNKRRKEESERSGKKKARHDSDRAAGSIKKRGSVPIFNVKKADFCEGAGLQVGQSDIRDAKNERRKEEMFSEPHSIDHLEGIDNDSKLKHVLLFKASKGGLPDEALKQKSSLEIPVKVEKVEQLEFLSTGISSRNGAGASHEERSDIAKEPEEEDISKADHGLKQPKDENHFEGDLNVGSCGVVINSENSRPATDYLRNAHPDVPATRMHPANGAISGSGKPGNIDIKIDGVNNLPTGNSKLPQGSIGSSPEISHEHETVMSSTSDEYKSQDADKKTEVSYRNCDKPTEGTEVGVSEAKHHEQVVEETAGSSVALGGSSESGYGSKYLNECRKPGDPNLSHLAPNAHKLVVGVAKASSTLSAAVITKPSMSGGYKSPVTSTASSITVKGFDLSKQQRGKVTTCTTTKKDNATVSSADESMREALLQPARGPSKGLDGPVSKSLQAIRTSVSASRHSLSDSKEQPFGPLSKASNVDSTRKLSGSGEAVRSSQTQNASAQIKKVASGSCQKNEKTNQAILQLPSKLLSHSVSLHPPASVNATSTLSDEELALLLHQELNSSPRVHRVPRVRQATCMQLTSPTTSMLSKRSSSSGGKDQVSVFRRKNKDDVSRDGCHNSRDLSDETKTGGRGASISDQKFRESPITTESSAKKDARNRSPDTVASIKKSVSCASIEGENSCPSSVEASGQNAFSVRSSPRDVPDDDASLIPRTLPGLVDEIISKGKCSTYEELCNAVQPHWHNLRKPNGERYAYSSHSQAVLDCLRNRSEWAHLIDRGPKTNSSKRRRKVDLDTPVVEESEYEEAGSKVSAIREVDDKNEDSHREDFPKGKRKARKRRRLELRGRGVKEAGRKPRHTCQGGAIVSSDDGDDTAAATFSHSSNEGVFSEDESQGAGQHAVATEVSTSSSDDTH